MYHSILSPVTDEIVSQNLASALREIPSWRLERALSFRFDRDKYLCAEAYLLLKRLLSSHYGITENVSFGYGHNGKPFLKSHPDIHFNISHCPSAIFCAVSDSPIGVDVEEIQYDEYVARIVLSDKEFNAVLDSDNPDVRFTEYWTQKEACLKLSGNGMTGNLKDLLPCQQTPCEFITEVHLELNVVTSVALFNTKSLTRNCHL